MVFYRAIFFILLKHWALLLDTVLYRKILERNFLQPRKTLVASDSDIHLTKKKVLESEWTMVSAMKVAISTLRLTRRFRVLSSCQDPGSNRNF